RRDRERGMTMTIDRSLRVLASLLLLAVAAGLLVWQQQVRYGEIGLADLWLGQLLAGGTHANQDLLFFSWAGGPMIGMRVTAECTSALLLAPLLALAAVLLGVTRAPWLRLLAGLAVGLALVVVVNQVRLAMIAYSLQ